MTALRLFAAAIELEGDRRAGQGIREIVEIIDKDVAEVCSLLDAARIGKKGRGCVTAGSSSTDVRPG